MKLDTKLCRISISDDIWFSGDGVLLDANIALGENERSSTCSISVYDPKLAIGSKYQKISIQQGGILVPDDLITSPKGTGTGGAATNEPGTLQTSGGGNQQENIKLIVAECIKQGVTDPKQIAYVLGTAQHESGFKPIPEIGGANARYAPYYGRGFVQITWKENYAKYSKKLGKDFVANPDLILEPRIAAFILVDGMKNGVFTGAKLGDFIGGGKADYTSARTIVNGTDRASLIAGYALDWEKKVPGLMGGNTNLQPPTTDVAIAPTTKVDPPQTETSSKGTEIIVEIGFSSTKKLIAFHFIHVGTQTSLGGGSKTTFEGKSIRWLLTRVPQTKSYEQVSLKDIATAVAKSYGMDLKMEGYGPRYEHLDQTGLTPLELLRRETSKIGYRVADDKATLIIEPEGRPHFSNFVVDEDSLISIVFTDKARGSKAIPFQKIADAYSGDKDTKFVLDRQSGQIQQFKNETFIGTPEASTKTASVTGKPSTVATGILKPSLNYGSSPTGFTDNIVGGQYAQDPIKVDKSDSTDDAGNKIHREKTTELSRKRGSIIQSITLVETRTITNAGGTVATTSNIVTTTQKDIVFLNNTDTVIKQTIVVTTKANGVGSITNSESTTIDADLQATLKLGYTPPPSSDNYGLPKQIPGILDLEDGKAEAQVISDEANRIKGYESTVKLKTNQEILQIVPGEIIGLSGRLFPDPFDREWRVYTVSHEWSPNITTIVIYTPQGLRKGEVSTDGETPGSSSPGAIPAGDYMYPCHGFLISSLKGMRTNPVTGAYRLHAGTDIAAPEGTPCQAAGNGKVTVAEVESGYGNIIRIDHGGGVITGYAHLSVMKVQVGQSVTKGQVIALTGSTGIGTGAHLHFEVYVNGECVTPSALKLAEPVLGMKTP